MTSTEGSIPGWMRAVICLCNAQGGQITSEEIANIAATEGKFSLGCTLVAHLKKVKCLSVEILDEKVGGHGTRKIKIYRVSRKAVTGD